MKKALLLGALLVSCFVNFMHAASGEYKNNNFMEQFESELNRLFTSEDVTAWKAKQLELKKKIKDKGFDLQYKDFSGRDLGHFVLDALRATLYMHEDLGVDEISNDTVTQAYQSIMDALYSQGLMLSQVDTSGISVADGIQEMKLDWFGNVIRRANERVKGEHPLVVAAKNNETSKVLELLHNGAAVDAIDMQGNTALMFAAQNGDIKSARALLQCGANSTLRNDKKKNALDLAVDNKRDKVIEVFGEFGINVGAQNNDWNAVPPLLRAAQNGDIATVEALLKAGANINESMRFNGSTALMSAAINGQLDVVRVLLAAGAAVDAQDEYGKSALNHVAQNFYSACVHTNVYNTKSGLEAEKKCKQTYIDIVEALLDAGANMNLQDTYGQTPYKRAHGSILDIMRKRTGDVGWMDRLRERFPGVMH